MFVNVCTAMMSPNANGPPASVAIPFQVPFENISRDMLSNNNLI